jgi:outer membrane immunogenic protein
VRGIEATFGSGTTTRSGWAAGAGVEYAFARDWTGKIEYLHIDLGNDVTYGGAIPHNVKFDVDLVRVGLNWKLNWMPLR